MAEVAIFMGSKSDLDKLSDGITILKDFGVSHEVHVCSAHRSPAYLMEILKNLEQQGLQVVIAAAGGAAHLAGVCAAHTILPVIGVPMDIPPLNGLDSLLSTVQMPGGIPVAAVSIGRAGAKNAALLAVAILSLKDAQLRERLLQYRKRMAAEIQRQDQELNQ
ncbi:MAG TPA: 5-(carboxyamino)imidazole ribonucleotide mutase [Acidobacteriota bacterium]